MTATETGYDYVIIGAGSAGCVLAGRLSEDPATTVLLIESGPPDGAPEIALPIATPTLWTGELAWHDSTEPQRGAHRRRIPWASGRVLGGSSSINGMVYIRGNRLDYDAWRDDYGAAGWGYVDLLPYFRRAEDQARGESAYHSTDGPLHVADQRYEHVLSRAWLEAAVAAGQVRNDDFNGPVQDGVGHYQMTQRDGARWSAADAYLRPALTRPNLTVRTDAHATQIMVDRHQAVAVRYLQDGASRDVSVAGEVIIACGAVRSPQLLLLSGIGPADQLSARGLPVAVDAPRVGMGLQDHPVCVTSWRTPDIANLWEEVGPDSVDLWERERRGPMASLGAEVGGFARSHEQLPAPDLQFGAIPGPPPLPDLGPDAARGVGTLVGVVSVRSRGSVTLASSAPTAAPIIDPACFTDGADLDALVAGIRLARAIAASQPLADLTDGELAPGIDIDDEARLRDWIRANVATMYHATGTCAMGSAPTTVCDPELRVRGVARLRVVDASVMPVTPRGNTNAPTIAVAERAADLIRGNTPLRPTAAAAVENVSPCR